MSDVLVWVKAHPVTTGGVAVGGLIVVYLLLHAGSGGGVSSSTASAGPSSLQLQQDAEQFQAGQTATAANYQLASGAQQIAGQIQLATLSLTGQQNQLAAQLSATKLNDALQLAQTQAAATTQNNATAASLEALKAQFSAQTQQETIAAANSTALANINANVQITQSNNFSALEALLAQTQASVTNNQTDATVKIAGINAGVLENAQNKQAQSNLLGGIFGVVGAIFGL